MGEGALALAMVQLKGMVLLFGFLTCSLSLPV